MNDNNKAHKIAVSRRIIFVHTAGILLLILSGMGTLLIATRQFDKIQREASQVMVEVQISALRDKTETFVRDYSVWDEAYYALKHGDIDWIYRNIGTAATDIGALNLIVILDPRTNEALRWVEGAASDGSAPSIAPDVISEIISLRPDDPLDIEWKISMVRMVDNVPWIFAATAVRPIDLQPGDIPISDLPLQIHANKIDSDVLEEIAAPILIKDLHVVEGPTGQEAFAPFGKADGDGTVGLAWTPPSIGAAVLASIFWPLLLSMALIGAIATFVSRHTVQSAQALERALDEARAADRVKTEFLSNVSHELKTPMNGIIGSIQLLEMTDLDDEQAKLIEILSASADLQFALVSDLLDIAQFDSGKRTLKCEPIVPADIIGEAAGIFRKLAIDKGLEFRCEVSGATGVMVYGDSRGIRQVVNNLVSNAVKFTDFGSVSVIATASYMDARIVWEIAVVDTGPGIEETEMRRIFDRFYQVDRSLARLKDGVGLGLAISLDLARQMGGDIVVSNNLHGLGSTFTFSVSLAPAGAFEADIAA